MQNIQEDNFFQVGSLDSYTPGGVREKRSDPNCLLFQSILLQLAGLGLVLIIMMSLRVCLLSGQAWSGRVMLASQLQ